MTKFVLLYSGGGMPETEEEQAAVMAAWFAWYEAMGEAVFDAGNPFAPVAKTISSGGSVSDGNAPSTGYTIISADSIEAAVELAKGCPNLTSGGSVSVCETFPIPDM
jgi:hypothetical protein